MSATSSIKLGARYVIPDRVNGLPVEYQLERRLGLGSYSETFLAIREDGKLAALKIPREGRATAANNLRVEMGMLTQLAHRNLVRLLGSCDEPLIVAYERVFQNPLLLLSKPENRQHLPADPGTRFYPLPPRIALAISLDLLRGLEAMHQAGFVHNDVKPENLMVRLPRLPADAGDREILASALGGQGCGVLIDLGGSRSLSYLDDLRDGNVDSHLVPPQLTPAYAAPEALLATSRGGGLGLPIDIYAAALVVYVLVSGREPYDHLGMGKRGLDRVRKLKEGERASELFPIDYRALAGAPGAKALADKLYGFLSTCLDRRPEKRPSAQSARSFLQELEQWFKRLNGL